MCLRVHLLNEKIQPSERTASFRFVDDKAEVHSVLSTISIEGGLVHGAVSLRHCKRNETRELL